jgi:hypothetical protein
VALNVYLQQVQSLLDDAGAVEYTTAALTTFINDARLQIAGSSESIRVLGTLHAAIGFQSYAFVQIVDLPDGVAGALNIRKMRVSTTDGWAEIFPREWEWFWSNCLCGPVSIQSGLPDTFSVLKPGIGGGFYLSPTPNAGFLISADCVGYPVNLVDDTTPEQIPAPWTEAIQYYAAYLALLNTQRNADADAMLQRYSLFEARATQITTPTTLPVQYPGQAGARVAGEARSITTAGQEQGAG